MIISAIVFAVSVYALEQWLEGIKHSRHKSHDKGDAVSRASSRMNLVSHSKY
jgi:hypothetical protein